MWKQINKSVSYVPLHLSKLCNLLVIYSTYEFNSLKEVKYMYAQQTQHIISIRYG